MVVSPAFVVPFVMNVAGKLPGDRAIGGCVASTATRPAGTAVFQSGATPATSPSGIGAVTVSPGRLVMSAAESDRRIRRLVFVKYRSPNTIGFVTFSVQAA